MRSKDKVNTEATKIEPSIYRKFGTYYDTLYDPYINYTKECDQLERLFNGYLKKGTGSGDNIPYDILDMGCGTGNHALELGLRGHKIIAVDQSLECLRSAKEKIRNKPYINSRVDLIRMDIRKIGIKYKFDIILTLFGIFSYLPEKQHLETALVDLRTILKKGGLLIGEIWQTSGVPNNFENRSTGRSEDGSVEVTRTTRALKPDRSMISSVKMDFSVKDLKSGEIKDTFSETHLMRSYDLDEFRNSARESEMDIIKYYSADKNIDNLRPVKSKSFRVLFIMKAA